MSQGTCLYLPESQSRGFVPAELFAAVPSPGPDDGDTTFNDGRSSIYQSAAELSDYQRRVLATSAEIITYMREAAGAESHTRSIVDVGWVPHNRIQRPQTGWHSDETLGEFLSASNQNPTRELRGHVTMSRLFEVNEFLARMVELAWETQGEAEALATLVRAIKRHSDEDIFTLGLSIVQRKPREIVNHGDVVHDSPRNCNPWPILRIFAASY